MKGNLQFRKRLPHEGEASIADGLEATPLIGGEWRGHGMSENECSMNMLYE